MTLLRYVVPQLPTHRVYWTTLLAIYRIGTLLLYGWTPLLLLDGDSIWQLDDTLLVDVTV